eukprot:RCo012447
MHRETGRELSRLSRLAPQHEQAKTKPKAGKLKANEKRKGFGVRVITKPKVFLRDRRETEGENETTKGDRGQPSGQPHNDRPLTQMKRERAQEGKERKKGEERKEKKESPEEEDRGGRGEGGGTERHRRGDMGGSALKKGIGQDPMGSRLGCAANLTSTQRPRIVSPWSCSRQRTASGMPVK